MHGWNMRKEEPMFYHVMLMVEITWYRNKFGEFEYCLGIGCLSWLNSVGERASERGDAAASAVIDIL